MWHANRKPKLEMKVMSWTAGAWMMKWRVGAWNLAAGEDHKQMRHGEAQRAVLGRSERAARRLAR